MQSSSSDGDCESVYSVARNKKNFRRFHRRSAIDYQRPSRKFRSMHGNSRIFPLNNQILRDLCTLLQNSDFHRKRLNRRTYKSRLLSLSQRLIDHFQGRRRLILTNIISTLHSFSILQNITRTKNCVLCFIQIMEQQLYCRGDTCFAVRANAHSTFDESRAHIVQIEPQYPNARLNRYCTLVHRCADLVDDFVELLVVAKFQSLTAHRDADA